MKRLSLTIILVCAALFTMTVYENYDYSQQLSVTNGVVTTHGTLGSTWVCGGVVCSICALTGQVVILAPNSQRVFRRHLEINARFWEGVQDAYSYGPCGWFKVRYHTENANVTYDSVQYTCLAMT